MVCPIGDHKKAEWRCLNKDRQKFRRILNAMTPFKLQYDTKTSAVTDQFVLNIISAAAVFMLSVADVVFRSSLQQDMCSAADVI